VLWSSAGIAWPVATADVVLSDRDAAFAGLDELSSPFHVAPVQSA